MLWELYCGTPHWRRNDAPRAARGGDGRYAQSRGDRSDFSSDWVDRRNSGSVGYPERSYGGRGGAGAPVVNGDGFSLPRSCPAEYAELVASCLSPDPGLRPTATEALAALQRLQQVHG